MAHDLWRRDLRIATALEDAAGIASILEDQLPDDGLQHAGDAVLVALAADPVASRAVAITITDALRTRCWNGDDELADAIDTQLGHRPSTLTVLAVDLDLFADALTEPAGSVGYLDLHSGIVHTEATLEYTTDDEPEIDLDDTSRWLAVPGDGSVEAYRDMQRFITTVTDPDLARRLTDAIDGRGAFRRFYNVIATDPVEHTRWQRYSDDARLGHARSWLAEHGYQPAATTKDSP